MRPLAILTSGLSAATRFGGELLALIGRTEIQRVELEALPILFANEAAPLPFVGEPTNSIEFANEAMNQQDRTSWVQLAPFGRFDNAQGMQVFDRTAAETIVENFANASLWKAPGIKLFGAPWYVGHPDHPSFRDRDRDQTAYGRIKKLEVRENGLFANVKWSEDGAAMVRDEKFHGHSVVWNLLPVPGKSREFRPVALQSVGFTNNPNIPVEPARLGANEKDNMTAEQLKALGLEANATEAQIATAFAAVIAAANEAKTTKDKLSAAKIESVDAAITLIGTHATTIAANETKITELNGKVTTLEGEKTTLTTQVGTLTTEKKTATEAFANERAARIKTIVDDGIKGGRIVEADRTKWTDAFANEATFETKLTEFNGLKAKIAANSALNLGDRKGIATAGGEQTAAQKAGAELRSKATTIMANEAGCPWDRAWTIAKEQNPALVVAMEAKV